MDPVTAVANAITALATAAGFGFQAWMRVWDATPKEQQTQIAAKEADIINGVLSLLVEAKAQLDKVKQ